MVRAYLILIMLCVISICNAQNKRSSKEEKFDEDHGVMGMDRIDSITKKEIRIVQLTHSIAVIFPARYRKEKFGYDNRFTPDTDLVKRIDEEIVNQYCAAAKHLNDQNWADIMERDTDKEDIKKIKRNRAKSEKSEAKWCPRWKKNLEYYDKQYWGFITVDGRKTVCINLLDFRQDPYDLKRYFYTSWIDGWHGWFETNHITMYYHLDNNLITINFN